MSGGRGNAGDCGDGLPGQQNTARDVHLVETLGVRIDGGGQQLSRGDGKIEKGKEELGADDEDPGPGGGQPEVI